MGEIKITQADVDRINAEFVAMMARKAARDEAALVELMEIAIDDRCLSRFGVMTGKD